LNELLIPVCPATDEIMQMLEKKELLQRLLPSEKIISTPEKEVGVDIVYSTDMKFGTHTLICVGFNKSIVDMAYHSDNEEFILVNEGRQQKPLILIIGLHKEEVFKDLVFSGRLKEDAILALELKFNDPLVSFFTMNAHTPHCEWTIPGNGAASVFYVTEPSDLDVQPIDMKEYKLIIDYQL
jgi:hypothetical protein